MRRALLIISATVLFVPAFCGAEPQGQSPVRWALKTSSSGVFLLDTQTGNMWVMKADPSDVPAELRFQRVRKDGEEADSSADQEKASPSNSQPNSAPLRIHVSHRSHPKDEDPTMPNQ